MTLKKDVETSIEDNTSATVEYMKQINESFIAALEDERKQKEHQQLTDAVLAAWLALMFQNFEDDLYASAQTGIDEADKQLKNKKITEVKDKNITVQTYEAQVTSRLESVKSDLVTVAEEIKSNSSSVFKDISTKIDKKKTPGINARTFNDIKTKWYNPFLP